MTRKGLALAAALALATASAGCYKKTARADGEVDVSIEIAENPYLENRVGCPHPVFSTIEYKVTNDGDEAVFIDSVRLEGLTAELHERFFDWTYIDQDHHVSEPGRPYTVRLEGILVDAALSPTEHFQYGTENLLRATLSYHTEHDEGRMDFQAAHERGLDVAASADWCPTDP